MQRTHFAEQCMVTRQRQLHVGEQRQLRLRGRLPGHRQKLDTMGQRIARRQTLHPFAEVEEHRVQRRGMTRGQGLLRVHGGLIQEGDNAGIAISGANQLVAPEFGPGARVIIAMLGRKQRQLQQRGAGTVRCLTLGLGEGLVGIVELAFVDEHGAETLPGGRLEHPAAGLGDAQQEGLLLLPVIELIVGIAEDVQGRLETLVQRLEITGEERLQQAHGPSRAVLIQPSLGHFRQQGLRHGLCAQRLLQLGLGELVEQHIPDQFLGELGHGPEGLAAVTVAQARAAGTGLRGRGWRQRRRLPLVLPARRGIPDGDAQQRGQPPLFVRGQVLVDTEVGRYGVSGPDQETLQLHARPCVGIRRGTLTDVRKRVADQLLHTLGLSAFALIHGDSAGDQAGAPMAAILARSKGRLSSA